MATAKKGYFKVITEDFTIIAIAMFNYFAISWPARSNFKSKFDLVDSSLEMPGAAIIDSVSCLYP